MRFFARQNFEGLTIMPLTRHPETSHFVGGSAAGHTIVTPEKLVRVQYGTFSPGVSTLDMFGAVRPLQGYRPASVEYVKELPELPDRPRRKIRRHTRPDRVDLCRYVLGGKSLVIRCNHQPYKEEKEAENVMSARTKAKVRNKVQTFFYWAQEVNRPLYFLTLTFIGAVDDRQAQKVLNKFFNSLRKMQPGLHYLWVAERQENGNIHFHAVIDRFMDVRRINTLWTRTQINAGIRYRHITFWQQYLGNIRNGTIKALNPLDVRKVSTLNGLNQYLTKYVTKNGNKFSCRVWHCSRSLSALGVNTYVPAVQVEAHNSERINQFTDKKGTVHTTSETIIVKHEAGEYLKEKYRYRSKFCYWIKTLNKPELHQDIRPYISHYNREIMASFERLADLAQEKKLCRALYSRARLTPAGLHLYPLHAWWERLEQQTKEIRNRLYWIIPLVHRNEVLDDEKFCFT